MKEGLQSLPAMDPMALGERILELLGEGAVSTSYKYAVLLSIVELCIEKSGISSGPPSMITTREVAEKVVELYWTHTLPYSKVALRQSGRGQAELIKLVSEFRQYRAGDPSKRLAESRREGGRPWQRLLSDVEWKLIEMPLPRLQTVGNRSDDFLYRIGWDQSIKRSQVSSYQTGNGGAFDNGIYLRPGVADALVRLSPLLKPMIRRQWTLLVARLNHLEVSELEDFLFGETRTALTGTRDLLADLQGTRCFYCHDRLDQRSEVDHFIPWSRYANNALENLVLAHRTCNHDKRDYLASFEHIEAWSERMRQGSSSLRLMRTFADHAGWDHKPERSLAVTSAIYSHLPEGYSLWQGIRNFVPFEKSRVLSLFHSIKA